MQVIEFYLKSNAPKGNIEGLSDTFYQIPNPIKRRIDGETASAVFAITLNENTRWVQLLVDEDTPSETLDAIRSKAEGMSDNEKIAEYHSEEGLVTGQVIIAPRERPREKCV